MAALVTEREILQKAIDAWTKQTGLHFTMDERRKGEPGAQEADALLRLQAPGRDLQFVAEVMRTVTNATLGALAARLGRHGRKGILVTEYVNPKMAERLKGMGVPFLDAAGNAYMNKFPILVYIKGERPAKPPRGARPTRAFRQAGLKVLFALLCNPRLANENYRQIARVAGVALGTIGWVVADLNEQGFWLDMGKLGRKLVNKPKLLERWVTAYPEQLKPKLLIGRFATPKTQAPWWEHVRIGDFNAYWGGEVAAAMLTHHLRPEFTTVYIRDRDEEDRRLRPTFGLPAARVEEFVIRNRLTRDPRGDVEILRAFWAPECDRAFAQVAPFPDRDRTVERLAPPLLVYADLLATGDDRCVETAKRIYEQYLTGLIGEN